MKTVSISCPNCLGRYSGVITSRFMTCEYCGSRYALAASELKKIGFVDKDGDGYDDNDQGDFRGPERDSSKSSLSMEDFAEQAIQEMFEDIGNTSDFNNSDMIEYGLGIDESDRVLLLHDDTFFKSGKNGFALTSSGIYCREMGEGSAHFRSWEEFAHKGKPQREGSLIKQGGFSVCYFTDGSEMSNLERLYKDLWDHARRVF